MAPENRAKPGCRRVEQHVRLWPDAGAPDVFDMRLLVVDPDPARAALVAEGLTDLSPRDVRRTARLAGPVFIAIGGAVADAHDRTSSSAPRLQQDRAASSR
jgi:hypothetical protein